MRKNNSLFKLIKALFAEWRLMLSLAIRDFRQRFAGSFFGAVWGLLNPLLTILIYLIIFKYGFRTGDTMNYPFVLWFISGIIVWLFYSESLNASSNAFIEYSYLVKKVVFNIDILPLVKIISCLFIHLFFIILTSAICAFMGFYPTIYCIQLPYYMICTIINLYGVALIFSSIIVFFRDLSQIINIILLLGMWGTPIAWELSIFPEKVHKYLKLNPIFYLVEGYRDSFLGREWFWEKPYLSVYYWIVSIVLLLIGMFVYIRLKHRFADVL